MILYGLIFSDRAPVKAGRSRPGRIAACSLSDAVLSRILRLRQKIPAKADILGP
ncbi:hypothetical protein ABIE64_004453 [Thalassospira sp. MBR-102]